MSYDVDPVTWAGVVIRLASGKTYAVELDGTQSRVTFELNTTRDHDAYDDFSRVAYVPRSSYQVDVHLSGSAMTWYDAPKPPERREAIGEQTRAIKGATS